MLDSPPGMTRPSISSTAGLFDEHNFGAQLFEPFAVRVEIALEGEDPDFHARLSASDSRAIRRRRTSS